MHIFFIVLFYFYHEEVLLIVVILRFFKLVHNLNRDNHIYDWCVAKE